MQWEKEEEEANVAITVAALDILQENVPPNALAKEATEVIKVREKGKYRDKQHGQVKQEEAKMQEVHEGPRSRMLELWRSTFCKRLPKEERGPRIG